MRNDGIAIRLPLILIGMGQEKYRTYRNRGVVLVGIAVLVIDHDRFTACLAGMTMFRCSGRLD